MTILSLFRSGLDTVEIAKRLGITEAQAYSKLNGELDAEYQRRRDWRTENEARLQKAMEAI